MTGYIIHKRRHPLDRIWEAATEALSEANHAMDALGDDHSDAELDAAGEVRTQCILAIQALPVRNLSDAFAKLDAAQANDQQLRNDCSLTAIIDEALDCLDASIIWPTSREAWDNALSAYRVAKIRDDACQARDPDEDNVNEAYWASISSLIRVPAPDHAALKLKLELLQESNEECAPSDEQYQAIIVDVCRLGGLAVPA